MFNAYFFGGTRKGSAGKKALDFMKSCDCIVVDPPFGGVLEALGETIRWIWRLNSVGSVAMAASAVAADRLPQLPTMVFLPYFLAPRFQSCLPPTVLTDFRASYTNHATFKEPKAGKSECCIMILEGAT
jgi:hypothetical protein